MTSPAVTADLRSAKAEARQHPENFVKSERARELMGLQGKRDLFYLTSVILGYDRLTKDTHGPVCRFHDTCELYRRMFLYPRTHFKSTIITISGSIQDIVVDPNVTMLLGAATDKNAQRFLEEIKRHFMNNQVLRWLFPELMWESDRQAPRWNKQEMEVPRDTFVREPTIDTIGTGGEVISRHYLKIKLDDIIGERQYHSEAEMDAAREWLKGIESLLVPPFDEHRIDIVGTRWKLDDVYALAEYMYGGGKGSSVKLLGPHAYKRGYRLGVLTRKVRENGAPIFPEAFNERQLGELQRADPMRFAAQYLNDPLASGTAEFENAWLKYYHLNSDGDILLDDYDKPIKPHKLMTFILCDPSLGETKRSDRTAIHVVGVHLDKFPRLIMLDSVIERMPPDKIISKLFEFYDKYPWTKLVSLETWAFQKALKYWIEQLEAGPRVSKPRLPIQEFTGGAIKIKIERIKGTQPIFRAGQCYILPTFGDFIDEYQAWHPEAKWDDGMDAFSQILEYVDFGWTQDCWDQIAEFDAMMRESRDVLTGSWSGRDPVLSKATVMGV